ncbi:MAG: alpha/beta hydrolase [Chloroflexi bacterium]|nr:alpha/beta hydrolase [Chloroflexota bacterium]
MHRYLKTWIALVGLLILLVSAGLPFAGAQDDPPITSGLVDIGGYSLYIDCQGEGSPTVILDSGTGSTGRAWLRVQGRIARFTRVCSYDRAGLGGSDPSPLMPRTSQVIAEELHTLLENARVPGPYVLVGHSFGGHNIRLFAHTYPDEVAGMVLVDVTHEDVMLRFGELSPAWEEEFINAWRDPEGITLEAWYATQEQLRAVRAEGPEPVFGDIPLVVLTATQEDAPLTSPTDEENEAFRQAWYDLQTDLATMSSNSQHIFAEKSGHMIQDDEPALVVEAVQWVVEQIALEDAEGS